MPPPNEKELLDWCLLEAKDKRKCHVPIVRRNDQWHVKDKVPANWPMILVSWWGANAYSLWAHGKDWHEYKSALQSFLPSEAQWEYAARGTDPQDFPWGAEECADLLNVCWDQEIHKDLNGNAPALHDFPLEPVNLTKGQSPFGLRGMAGNVWQWCRDSYDPDFYSYPLALATDAWNSLETPFRSERGGSWVGPSNLARSSFRRGRCPEAKGRCLGFRCCAPGEIVSQRSSAWNWCFEHILSQMMHWCLKGDSCTVKDSLLHRKMFRHWKSKIKSVLVSLHHDQVAWSVAIIISPHRFHHEFHPAMLKAHWPKNVLRVLMPALRKLGDSHGHIIVAPQPARGELGG